MEIIHDIRSFIIRDTLPDTPAEPSDSRLYTEIEYHYFKVEQTLTRFDFVDNIYESGYLLDNEILTLESPDATIYGTRVIVDGASHFVQTFREADLTLYFDDGHRIFHDNGARLFALGTPGTYMLTGDILVNPIDDLRSRITAYIKAHPGVSLTGYKVGKIDDDVLSRASLISMQDDSFPICFAAGTILDTADGLRAVQDLRIGDLLLTFDNGYQPIRWIGSRSISASELAANPKLRPVTIQAGALGKNQPSMPLTLSPQHRVMIRSAQAIDLFGTDEILVPVKKLIELPGIDHADLMEVTYYHVLMDKHEILWSNGCLSESLYLGSQALQAITQEGRDEIASIFPGIADGSFLAARARPFAERRKHIRQVIQTEVA